MNKKRWVLKNQDSRVVDSLSKELSLHPLVVNVLLNRGMTTSGEMQNFIYPKLGGFHDPLLMKDMQKAVKRIKDAVRKSEKIAIYGDYDVDGITSVSVLYLALQSMGADVCYYIPNRLTQGYGVNREALQKLFKNGVGLIVTVDCGITANDEIAFGKQMGLDIIVTDHHRCPEIVPDALAVINPKQNDCPYPFKELAGVGVAFKLVQALLGMENLPQLIKQFSSLVALGTVADIVALQDENRLIVYQGIKNMSSDENIGIQALLEESGLKAKVIDSGTLGFQLAPRINASGRIGDAGIGVELFASNDKTRVRQIAAQLEQQNEQRKAVEQEILDEANRMIHSDKSILGKNIILLRNPGWHHGVIGIVASRLTEEYYKPCILFTEENGLVKGSARSVRGFNIYDALTAVSEFIDKFGGHELAAGLTVDIGKFESFQTALESYCHDHVTSEMLIQQVSLDGEIHDSDLSERLIEQLKMLEPFGMGNAQPNFLVRKAKIVKNTAFKEGKHLKLSLCQREKYIDAVGFSMGKYSSVLKNGDQISVAGNIYINEFRGERYFSIRIKDIRLS